MTSKNKTAIPMKAGAPVRKLFGLLETPGRRPVSLEAMNESIAATIKQDDERIKSGE